MKIIYNSMLILIFLIVATAVSYGNQSKPVTVTFACEDKHNFPFYIGNSLSFLPEKPGVSVEVLKALEQNLRIRVNFKRLPWKRCKVNLRKGSVDGIFNASYRPERVHIGGYPMVSGKHDQSKRLTTISYVLYTRIDSKNSWNPDAKTVTALTGEVCAPLGYSIVSDLKGYNIPVVEMTGTFDCFRMMMKDKSPIQAVAALEFAGDYFLEQNQDLFQDIKKNNPPIISKPYYLMLSHQFIKKNPQLSREIWAEIEVLRETLFSSLLKKYMN